jgi:hypothetical protein
MPGVLASALFNATCFSLRQVQLHLPASQEKEMIQYIRNGKNARPNKSNNAKDETINHKDNKLVAESTKAPSNFIETAHHRDIHLQDMLFRVLKQMWTNAPNKSVLSTTSLIVCIIFQRNGCEFQAISE